MFLQIPAISIRYLSYVCGIESRTILSPVAAINHLPLDLSTFRHTVRFTSGSSTGMHIQ